MYDARGFSDKSLKEDCIFNVDKIHVSVNLDDNRKLFMKGETLVKYSGVVSGDMGMTMMALLEGGSKLRVDIPVIIFQNDWCSHLIQGVPDTALGIC